MPQEARKVKGFILPLLFYKRLSDVFEDRFTGQVATFGDTELARTVVEQDHLAALKAAGKELAGTRGASLIVLDDGVICLEFHSKANAIGPDAMGLLSKALDLLDSDDNWRAPVLRNQGQFFAAGVAFAAVGGGAAWLCPRVARGRLAAACGWARPASSGGWALPPGRQRRFTGRFGVQSRDGIGSAECLHSFLSNSPDDIHPGTTGRAVPGYDLQLRDPFGELVPQGQPGTLHVRGESIALGYWRRTAASRQVFVGEWLNTGDTYLLNDEGYYTCLGRSNDLIKAGGIWVAPSEVEARLLEHPQVAEAAVVGLLDADGLDKPVACVVTQGPVTQEELIHWCRQELAHFKCPRAVVFTDELPKTATGKLQRFKVRELVANSARRTLRQPPTTTVKGVHQ